MSLEPRESGGPIQKFWEESGTINTLEQVKSWLLKNAKKHVASDPPTGKSLALLLSQFIELQETSLGRKAKNPPLVRLPVRLFYDFTTKGEGGSLCTILLCMYKYKTEQGWRRWPPTQPWQWQPPCHHHTKRH